MNDLSVPQVVVTARTPTELLQAQVQLLTEIKQAHEFELGQLRQQTEQLQRFLKSLTDQQAGTARGLRQVKIVDFNMPFMALVGILTKFALASIPAGLIIGALLFVFSLVFGAVFSTLGFVLFR
jgi:hypothetical protein